MLELDLKAETPLPLGGLERVLDPQHGDRLLDRHGIL